MKITHANGTSEYVTIERADEPIEIGTPINKALFDSIISRLALINKYNIPEITVEDSTNKLHINLPLDKYDTRQIIKFHVIPTEFEDFTTNIFPTGFTSSKTVIDGFKTSNYNAFNGNTGDYVSTDGQKESIVSIECPMLIIPKQISTYLYYSSTGSAVSYVRIYGSLDGITWTHIAGTENIGTHASGIVTRDYTLTTNTPYRFFKLIFNWNTATSYKHGIAEFKITAGKKSTYNSTYITKFSIGELDEVTLPDAIYPFKDYSLIYEDNTFKIEK